MQTKTTTLIAAIAALLALSCNKQPVPEGPRHLQVGEQVPAFSVVTLDGKTVSDETLKGKRSLIVLFSTTCPDCHKQLPDIQQALKITGSSMNYIAIARDEDGETVSTFWKKNKYTVPVAAPGDRTVYDLFDRGSGTGVPQVYVLDEKGTVVDCSDDKELMTVIHILGPDYRIEDIDTNM